ncbi:DUF2809 domain-containing protein [Neobacillus sp. SAB-20_R2A]|uniref:ribosomal maturation YjgA family protein n=1 Tax=Neobacillus sp. SAB-20_R2A TaxID=3120519 RepID=UPI003C6E8219
MKRSMYLTTIIIVILLGLASRKYGQFLPPFIAENAGDALWAMMVYFGFRFLLAKKSIQTAIILSILFSFGIEFSQLYQANWINQIRGTVLGALVLGQGFLAVDLLRYLVGILIGSLIDRIDLKINKV